MYFWNIKALKKHIVETGLSEAQMFYYILLFVGLMSAANEANSYVDRTTPNAWDYLDSAVTIAIDLIGTYAVYRANGGAAGSNFAAKYFSIGLVVFLRFIPLGVPLMFGMAAYDLYTQPPTAPESPDTTGTGWLDIAVPAALYIALYARTAKHVRDTARSGASLPGASLPGAPQPGTDARPADPA